MTTSAPAAPNAPSNIMAMAASASARSLNHNDTLAGSEPVGLDHDRRALRADIGKRGGGATEAADRRRSEC